MGFRRTFHLMVHLNGESRNLLSTLLRQNQIFIVTTYPQNGDEITFVSPSFLQFTGFTLDDVIGRRSDFVLHERTPTDSLEKVEIAIEQYVPEAVSVFVRKQDQNLFRCDMLLWPLYDRSKNPTYVVRAFDLS
eukprot:c551_g1_i1.p1 GENE.c551_g1_i1~~c551_g1_i1.p1  ORF type:complete len:133 (-),score=19.25 c551_g1_i1:101-499(-)